MNNQMVERPKSEHRYHRHHHRRRRRRRHHKKIVSKRTLYFLVPVGIVCAGLAAMINSGSANFLTSYGNVAIRGIIIVVFPIIFIFYLCGLFADWIFDFFSFLFKLFKGKRR